MADKAVFLTERHNSLHVARVSNSATSQQLRIGANPALVEKSASTTAYCGLQLNDVLDSSARTVRIWNTPMDASSTQRKALFVVSQIGQLRRAQELAHQLGIVQASLAILYTKKNPQMAVATEAIADPNLFTEITKVEIHPASNDLSLLAANKARAVYKNLLATLNPDDLFVCSFERHYAILCEEAEKRGSNLALFEEGTAIYKHSVEGFSSFAKHSIGSAARTIYNRVWKKHPITKYVLAPLAVVVHQIFIIPKLMALTAWEIYKTPQLQKIILSRSQRAFLQSWNKFDTVYASNPSALTGHFKARQYVEASPMFNDPSLIEEARLEAVRHGIDGGTAIFASQSFAVDLAAMSAAIVHLLHLLAERSQMKVSIKLHPREKPATVKALRGAIERLQLGETIRLMEGVSVPAEYLAIYSDCQMVVSISSSTLMYAPKQKPLVSISIGNALVAMLKQSGISGPGLEQIEDHVRILDPISYIEQFRP
ncbi:hypothetical protein GOA63_31615 [Sinorhizobium meliloti]|uniref:alpha-2,8-polysialyltransferase family protein n=2 Tax=Rhizobium meliloti TaxID=382 RepID=UPI000310353F|nr:alpha-2,8-polysialyltransferase family protein [Sinorhizobium meliloti]MDE3832763.1 hypothetical protein [Sinorhizobium meliloti]MDE3877494.1 hypothetical protein [Sinorhizobium meliloti]MDE4581566.1 alpha-2,8-polysialyltransferase family protein [Sinorhizobium meliloti]MDW9596682.1 hypothetical protein [Sinorhizobium meliloti]MDX0191725.1 hypothetical protein [Sinorhizobium meliloti]